MLLSGCGGSSVTKFGAGGNQTPNPAVSEAPAAQPSEGAARATQGPGRPPTAAAGPSVPPVPVGRIAGSTDLTAKPAVPLPADRTPQQLGVDDIVVGSGAVATAGQMIQVRYVGVNAADGKEFDSSWSRGMEPFPFTLGAGAVIPGWDQGLLGMKVGGRRLLVIPPALGYGGQANGPIVANETLAFVVDLVAVGQ